MTANPNINRLREFIGAWHRDTVDVMEAEAALAALASELDTAIRERDTYRDESEARHEVMQQAMERAMTAEAALAEMTAERDGLAKILDPHHGLNRAQRRAMKHGDGIHSQFDDSVRQGG